MSFQKLINRTTIANLVTGGVVIGGFTYAALTMNTDLITFITGAAIGYLLKEVKNNNRNST